MRKAIWALLPLLSCFLVWTNLLAVSADESAPESTAGVANIDSTATAVEPSVYEETFDGGCTEPCATECATAREFFGPPPAECLYPPSQLFLTPQPAAATVLEQGRSYLHLKADWTNVLIFELDSGVLVNYDFELVRLGLDYHRGMWGGELSARLPLNYRSHGIADNIISQWHQWFGMPNALRQLMPTNGYRYSIITRQGPVFNDEGDVLGLGDLIVEYKRPLLSKPDGKEALAVRATVKAPTGDSSRALGSGNWDFAVGALYQRQITPHLRGYVNFDWVFIGEPDWQNTNYQDTPTALLAAEYSLSPRTTVLSYYRYQRNPLRIGSYEADKDTAELAFGFNHRVADDMVWSGVVSEDINPETAPDLVVSSYLKLEW